MFENYFSPKIYVAVSNSALLADGYEHLAIVIKQIVIIRPGNQLTPEK